MTISVQCGLAETMQGEDHSRVGGLESVWTEPNWSREEERQSFAARLEHLNTEAA
jgi:hypothetical protein